jgi:hypothetical protein
LTLASTISSKTKKMYLKASNKQERDMWSTALKQAISSIESASISEFLLDLQGKLFVESQSMSSYQEGLEGVARMLDTELSKLSLFGEENTALTKQIRKIRNLANTLTGLSSNVIHDSKKFQDDLSTSLA